jgi:hypothetical protein
MGHAVSSGMVDWIAIGSAGGLAAIVGVGFVLWERYESERLARARLQRRIPRRQRRSLPFEAGRRAA